MSVSSSTCSEWVVLLEVADDDGYSGIDRNSFARLVESWVDARPTTVYSPSRYALQVSVEAASPALALSAALWRWKDALRHRASRSGDSFGPSSSPRTSSSARSSPARSRATVKPRRFGPTRGRRR